jgi:hypothetical protein
MVIIWLLLAVGEPIDNMGEFIGGQVLVLVARPR